MALIKCKNCGNFISDKAKACPKCGAPNIPSPTETNEDAKFQSEEKENTGHAINPEANSPYQEDNHFDPDQAPKPSHKKLYILSAILIIVIAGGIGYYFYAQHQTKLEEARLEAERIEKLRQDSIEAARIEAARLDSIRQDSIKRRTFTSHDLVFHDLHGDVKKCVNSNYYNLSFDENGNWTNEPTWDKYDRQYCPERTKKKRVQRDKEGRIIRIYNECESDEEYDDYTWDGNKLKKDKYDEYNEYGFIVYSYFEGWDGKDPTAYTTFCNYKMDGMQNWVKRDIITKSFEPGYPEDVYIHKYTQTRNITYYKSDKGEITSVPNNKRQKAAITLYKNNQNQ